MPPLRRLSVVEQAAEHLRLGLRSGRWSGRLPGVLRLAEELDVSKASMRAALRLVEAEGILTCCGRGRSRTSTPLTGRKKARRSLRVVILLRNHLADEIAAHQSLHLQLQHDLEAVGHVCVFSSKCQAELGFNLPRIIAHVEENPADAWLVHSASLELLQWFAARPVPAIALGGRTREVRIAGSSVNLRPVYRKIIGRLIGLGHRRIVFVCPREWRKPTRGLIADTFAEELALNGITATDYHLPDWEETPSGLRSLLDSLFRATPPTALVFNDPAGAVAALAFLAERGLRVPSQVSLFCGTRDNSFAWCHPPVAHFQWKGDLLVRRVVRWVGAVAKGCEDCELVDFPVEFVTGGSIGPPPLKG